MSARTMFWFAVVTLTAVWSANALPMVADEDARPPIYVVENLDGPKQNVEQQVDGTVASPVLKAEVETAPSVNGENDNAKDEVIRTDPNEDLDKIPEKLAPVPVVPDVEQTESATGTETPSSDVKPIPTFAPVQTEPITKPNFNKNAEPTVLSGANIPFFLEFFQPYQPYQPAQPLHPFQPFQPFGPNHQQQPSRHQPMIPFGAPIDPFPMHLPFNQMVDAYTNEFRNMLTSLNKMSMSQMDNVPNFGDAQGESDQPVKKTTSKTEIIDGHRVQINETTVTNGNGNHKSFYHYKEIQVLPEETNEKISNEQLTSVVNVDSDTQNVELGEPKDGTTAANASGSVQLDDHFQVASTNDYAPRYGFRAPYVSGMIRVNYVPMYPTTNKKSEPETSDGLLHDTDTNIKIIPSRPSGGTGKVQLQVTTTDTSSEPETETIDENLDDFNRMRSDSSITIPPDVSSSVINDKINSSQPSGGSGKLQLQVTTADPSSEPETETEMIDENIENFNQIKSDSIVSLINDTLINEWAEQLYKASDKKLSNDVELIFVDGNGQSNMEYDVANKKKKRNNNIVR